MVVDVWMQHPTLRFLQHDMFESLRRWTGAQVPDEELPIELTVRAMDEAGVTLGLLSAWHGRAAAQRGGWAAGAGSATPSRPRRPCARGR